MTVESGAMAAIFVVTILAVSSFGQSDMREIFMRSVTAGDARAVAELVKADPKLVSAKNAEGQSAVLLAAYYGRKEIMPILLKAGPRLDIFEAAAAGQTAEVREHVNKDKKLINAYSSDGFYPLGLAIFFGHTDTAMALLNAGAEVNIASKESMRVTPLHSAIAAGQIEIARELVRRGANVNARAEKNFTPLHEAAARGDMGLAILLVENRADMYAKTDDGKTPLDFAIESGQTAMAAYLRDRQGRLEK